MSVGRVGGGPTTASDAQRTVVVANAPCSYGAFEVTIGVDPHVPQHHPRPDRPGATRQRENREYLRARGL